MAYRLYYDEDYQDKLNQLLEVSNPREVIIKAIEYFKDPNIKVHLSTKKNKKYMIINPNNGKMVHFGDINYEDCIFAYRSCSFWFNTHTTNTTDKR